MFRSLRMRNFISKEDRQTADEQLPKLMFEGLLLGGTGLGVLALIFEIAADAFSVAAYQTLLAIHGAEGNHDIAMLAFATLSAMLFLGVVPAYKAGAYLSPNTGGSGPLVEAIGPEWLRWASWVGTSLFFLDAILTIIISSISAADVTMLIIPEGAPYRIFLAEIYAFFIMVVLVSLGPRRAVPLFLLGGGAFTIFTLFALGFVGVKAAVDPSLAEVTPSIIERLEENEVVLHVIEDDGKAIGTVLFFQLFLRSMSSAMLGFSGYEVIPASGKHAARPKWKVINTALTLAAIFLIGTGILQLYAASAWDIPSTEGYSTLLIEYELVFGEGAAILTIAGVLLAIILLLAQGGGYVGGAAVAANASRLGRLPGFFSDDRMGIAVIWGFAAILIPIIREVIVVEAYYAFGFVSAFVITSTTVFFVRDDVVRKSGIEPGSPEIRSLKFAGLRGMIASYIMLIVLVTQKTDALVVIVSAAAIITLLQLYIAWGGMQKPGEALPRPDLLPGQPPQYGNGLERSFDEARQRGIADLVEELIHEGALVKFNVEPHRIRRLVGYTHHISPQFWNQHNGPLSLPHDDNDSAEPSVALQQAYDDARGRRKELLKEIEDYSHYGIFTFIEKYHINWVNQNRSKEEVEKVMVRALFPNTPMDEIWADLRRYQWIKQPEEIWQFCRERYRWAKDQWPNLSDRVTTIWTLQDLGMIEEKDTSKILAAIMNVNEPPTASPFG
ncbi:MAG: APC family permease [Chloroflexi bacterium]|nr:APC family permease [Chloroflexota bacterium]